MWNREQPVVVTHKFQLIDVLYQRLYNLLRMGEQKDLKPNSIGKGGGIVSIEIAKKLKRGWKSESGELTEIGTILEDIAAAIDINEEPTKDVAEIGKTVIESVAKLGKCLKKTIIAPRNSVVDARSVQETEEEETKRKEKQGEVVKKMFIKQATAAGLSGDSMMTEWDNRANCVAVDPTLQEVSTIILETNRNCQPIQNEQHQDAVSYTHLTLPTKA